VTTATFTGLACTVTSANYLSLSSGSAVDVIADIRYATGSPGATSSLAVPMFDGFQNFPTNIETYVAANGGTGGGSGNVATWALIPPSYRVGVQSPWVIYVHGYGGSPADMWTLTGPEAQAQALLNAGYVVIGTYYSNQDCWGNASCTADIATVISQYRQYLNLAPQPYGLIGSMGELLGSTRYSTGR